MMTSGEIARLVNGKLHGDANLPLSDVASIDAAGSEHLSYVGTEKHLPALIKSPPGAVLITDQLLDEIRQQSQIALIVVVDPQAAFIQAMLSFRPPSPRARIGISPQAHVSATAAIGEDCNIHPGAFVGDRVVIGDRCEIKTGAVIGDDTVLGDDVTIHANAVLYHKVKIGARSIIHATAVIGADGFGYRVDNGRYHLIPHTGTVVIEEDVEIGAGTTIDRAMIEETVIGAGTKIDDQVMIAHNCVVGKHNVFASQVGLAGSVTTGDHVQCGGQVGVANHSEIGDGAALGGRAAVSGVIPGGQRYAGAPARPERDAAKAHIAMTRLPEMRAQLRKLIAQVNQLQSHIDQSTRSPESRAA